MLMVAGAGSGPLGSQPAGVHTDTHTQTRACADAIYTHVDTYFLIRVSCTHDPTGAVSPTEDPAGPALLCHLPPGSEDPAARPLPTRTCVQPRDTGSRGPESSDFTSQGPRFTHVPCLVEMLLSSLGGQHIPSS